MITFCFLVLILLGLYLVVFSIRSLNHRDSPSVLRLPWLKLELTGPAWLICVVLGVIMIASPIIAGAFQKPNNITEPPAPASVKRVQKINDPTYESFLFLRDMGILDLRTISATPWYSNILGWQLIKQRSRIKPSVFKNYMLIRKTKAANEIRFKYGTSGKLDIRSPTHKVTFLTSESVEDGITTESWEVTADVSAIPIGQEFEVVIEATYWNAFRGEKGDDFTTYSHDLQDGQGEEISLVVQFPEDRPFKDINITEYDGTETNSPGYPIQDTHRTWPGANHESYYFTVSARRPKMYYRLSWLW